MSIFCDKIVGAHPVSGLDPASVDGLDYLCVDEVADAKLQAGER